MGRGGSDPLRVDESDAEGGPLAEALLLAERERVAEREGVRLSERLGDKVAVRVGDADTLPEGVAAPEGLPEPVVVGLDEGAAVPVPLRVAALLEDLDADPACVGVRVADRDLVTLGVTLGVIDTLGVALGERVCVTLAVRLWLGVPLRVTDCVPVEERVCVRDPVVVGVRDSVPVSLGVRVTLVVSLGLLLALGVPERLALMLAVREVELVLLELGVLLRVRVAAALCVAV